MLLRSFSLFSFFTLAPLSASALCTGEPIDRYLSPELIAQVDANVASTPFAVGLGWHAEKDGRSIDLFGSMHVYDPRLESLRVQIGQVLATSDMLLVEQTLEEQQEASVEIMSDIDTILLPDNKTLPNVLSEETWDAVKEAAEARGIPPFLISRWQPWMVTTTLGTPACAVASQIQGEVGLDNMVMQDAAEYGIPTVSLEDWRDTLAILSKGSIDEQIEILEASLLPPDIENAMIVSMFGDYFAGNTARIDQLTRASISLIENIDQARAEELFDAFMLDLLDGRNAKWIPVIEDYASRGAITVVFGAAHLSGENGVLKLLENNGWTITRIE